MDDITAETARSLLTYDEATGVVRWVRPNKSRMNYFSIAGSIGADGYRKIKILGRSYQIHRVIWLIVTGEWPQDEIDHINRVRDDNRWINLRQVSRKENANNRSLKRCGESSPLVGLSFSKRRQKWRVYYYRSGKYIHIGEYKSRFSALEAAERTEATI